MRTGGLGAEVCPFGRPLGTLPALDLQLQHVVTTYSDLVIMVLLTMTPAVVAAVRVYNRLTPTEGQAGEPSLADPGVGNPISHGQMIDVSKFLKAHKEAIREVDGVKSVGLSDLLRGCAVYIAPPAPKPEKACHTSYHISTTPPSRRLTNHRSHLSIWLSWLVCARKKNPKPTPACSPPPLRIPWQTSHVICGL